MRHGLEALLVETTESALERWGYGAQLSMVAEECAELIVAIAHMQRDRRGADDEVVEEAADVTIALQYVRHIVGGDRIDAAIATKLARLRERLAKAGE